MRENSIRFARYSSLRYAQLEYARGACYACAYACAHFFAGLFAYANTPGFLAGLLLRNTPGLAAICLRKYAAPPTHPGGRCGRCHNQFAPLGGATPSSAWRCTQKLLPTASCSQHSPMATFPESQIQTCLISPRSSCLAQPAFPDGHIPRISIPQPSLKSHSSRDVYQMSL
jgi:hypothetical protein